MTAGKRSSQLMSTRSRKPSGERQGERYTHGYTAAPVAAMAARTVAREAAFFIPYLRQGMRVLDCGCGPGTITLGIAEVVSPGVVVGVDIAKSQVLLARENAMKAGARNTRFRVADIYQLPFLNGSFDAVFMHTILEHLAEPRRALKEVLRVLKPGGLAGARHGDLASRISYPPSRAIRSFFRVWQAEWRKNGGDPDFGRKQPALMRSAGFERLVTTSSTLHGNREQLNAVIGLEGIRAFLERTGVPARELDDAVKGGERWLADPDVFASNILVETVGWKPATGMSQGRQARRLHPVTRN